MAATSSIKNIWKLLEKFKEESTLLMNDEALLLLIYINRHERIKADDLIKKLSKHISQVKDIIEYLKCNRFIIEKIGLIYVTKKGKEIANIIEYSQYKIDEIPPNIIPGYVLEKPPIGSGSTSFTFKAGRREIKNKVIKIFKHGIFNHIDFDKKIEALQPLSNLPNLVLPDDYGEFEWNDGKFGYIVMKYIEGRTLKDFLNERVNNDLRKFLWNFIQEVARTLEKAEELGFEHGDLHSNNILVVEDELEKGKGIYHFQIIDFIGIKSNEEFREFELSDFDYFKRHLLKIVKVYASTPSGELDLKKLGERLHYIAQNLQNEEYHSFKDLFDGLSVKLPSPSKLGKIIEPPFSFIRFEQYDINDPLWLERFEPNDLLYEPIKRFDNIICSGPRGCGKTIYLRSLAFTPKLVKLIQNEPDKYSEATKGKVAFFDNVFGIYFACRQGEFKYFSNKYFRYTPKTQLHIKHIIALRIIKKALSSINDTYMEGVFSSEPKIEFILRFLTQYLVRDIMMTTEAKEKPFEQLEEILHSEENYCESILGEDTKYPSISKMLNEHLLIDFFKVLKDSVPELSNVKFYIIFDDVSEPQVPDECQKIINSFMSCLNEVYCCKFSTEKFAYTYEDMSGKTLQPTNDYTYIDLSFMGGPGDKYIDKTYKQYLEKIINRRLEIAGYQNINELLDNLPYSAQKLIILLSEYAKGNREVYNKIKFAGWDLIVQLSSRSVRDAIAICDSIFRECESIKNLSDNIREGEAKISVHIQDKSIKKHSREEYKCLVNITFHGREIFNIVRNFGEISRKYLEREITKEEDRKYEMITIERTDAEELSEDAKEIFRTLIRYSVFLDRGLSFSREEIGLVQKFTLHKKFIPALMTTYREREHLRLSKDRLENFILHPDEFRKGLLTGKIEDKHQLKLFDFIGGDRDE